jgi:hypothetical protein
MALPHLIAIHVPDGLSICVHNTTLYVAVTVGMIAASASNPSIPLTGLNGLGLASLPREMPSTGEVAIAFQKRCGRMIFQAN